MNVKRLKTETIKDLAKKGGRLGKAARLELTLRTKARKKSA